MRQQDWWGRRRRRRTKGTASVLGGLQPHQLHAPWGAAGRRRAEWHCGKGPAVGRCSAQPQGQNLASASGGHDPFRAARDASRLSWHRAAVETHKHMAERAWILHSASTPPAPTHTRTQVPLKYAALFRRTRFLADSFLLCFRQT